MSANTGINIGIEYFTMHPKKLGIGVPVSSAIDRTIKFGALPINVHAPKKQLLQKLP
jgi:hypothetical protein